MVANDINLIWDVYDEYRTARYNVYYYECKYTQLKRWNFWIELILALSVPSIAGLWIWENSVGDVIWQILIVVAGFLAVIKPLIGLATKIQETGEVLTKWRVLDGEFQKLTILVSQKRKYDDVMQQQFLRLIETKVTIKEPPGKPDIRLQKKCMEKVKTALPDKSFFIPEE